MQGEDVPEYLRPLEDSLVAMAEKGEHAFQQGVGIARVKVSAREPDPMLPKNVVPIQGPRKAPTDRKDGNHDRGGGRVMATRTPRPADSLRRIARDAKALADDVQRSSLRLITLQLEGLDSMGGPA